MTSKIIKDNCNIHDIEQAKKDYRTGFYNWYDLKQFYKLPVDVIFDIIFEVKKENK